MVGVCGFEAAAFFLGADLRLETPTFALSWSPFVITPGTGRLLRRVGALGAEPRGEPMFSSSPTGISPLLPRRKLTRRLGGSSLTALPALSTRVGRLEGGGVAARRAAEGLGAALGPAGARGTLEAVPAPGTGGSAILSFFGGGAAFVNGSGLAMGTLAEGPADVSSRLRFFPSVAAFDSAEGASVPCSRASCAAASFCSSSMRARFNFFASFKRMPRLISSASASSSWSVYVVLPSMAVIVACSSPEISTFVGSVSPGSSTNGGPPASAAALAASRPLTPRPRFLSSRLTMVEEGIQMAFFFIRLRSFAISHSVSLIQGIHMLPLTAVSGGGLRASRAFEVLMPASEECAFVPGCPGGRGALLGVNGLLLVFSLSGLGGLGVRERGRGVVGFSVRTGGSSTGGDTRGEVQSLMVSMGALGSGGGRTSPGTMTFLPRSLLAALSVRSRLFVLSATLISSGRTPSLLSRLRLGEVSARCSSAAGVGSLEGGIGCALSFSTTISSRLASLLAISSNLTASSTRMRHALSASSSA